MQKTRLGVSVGLLGAAIYFMGLFNGFLVVVLLAGYVLLFENNEWLKRSAVKAVVLMIGISLFVTLINLIPGAINLIDNIVGIFGGNFSIGILTQIVLAMNSAIDIVEKVLFIGLGIKALTQGTITIPIVDKLINKYMG